MRKCRRMLSVLLCLMLLFALMQGVTALPQKLSYQKADEVFGAIATAIEELKEPTTALKTDVARQVVQSLGYSVTEQGSDRFSWEAGGIPCTYDTRLQELAETAEPIKGYVDDGEVITVSYESKKTGPDSADVTLIEPYYGLDSSFTDKYQTLCSELAAKTGGTYTLYKNEQATIDNVAKALESSAVVVFDSHGSTDFKSGDDEVSQANTSYLSLQTSDGITQKDYAKLTGSFGEYSHAQYYASGAGGNSLKYYCVDGTAIANHMTKQSPNSLVWMAMCLGMATDGMCKPLRDNGAGVVYGYSQNMSFVGEYAFAVNFFESLGKGADVKTAIATMKKEVALWDALDNDIKTVAEAQAAKAAFPVVVSALDAYPGQGKVDNLQTVNSDWDLFTVPGNYQLTALSSDPACGTVSLYNRKITAAPAIGYAATGYTVSPEGACSVTQQGNAFTVSGLKQDCTVTVQFAKRASATVSYEVPAGVSCEATATFIGDRILLPKPTGTPADTSQYYRFLGWTSTPVDDVLVKPEVLPAGTEFEVTKTSRTLCALYAYTDASKTTADFAPVTSALEDWSGEYVLSFNSEKLLDASGKYLYTQLGSKDAALAIADAGITLSNGVMNNVSGSSVYVLHRENAVLGQYSIRMKNSSNFLSYPAGVNSATLTTAAAVTGDSELWTVSFKDGLFTLTNVASPSRSLMYNTVTQLFRCYSGGQQALSLYSGLIGVNHYTTLCPSARFTDVDPTKWYHKAVDDMITRKLMSGTSATTFAPDANYSRAMLVMMLYNLEKKPAVSGDNRFPDVKDNFWYTAAITWASSQKLVEGYPNGNFGPNDNITREQIAALMYRYQVYKKGDVSATNDLSAFPDAGSISSYARISVQWAVGSGLISGMGGKLAPRNSATRAMAAQIFMQYLTK